MLPYNKPSLPHLPPLVDLSREKKNTSSTDRGPLQKSIPAKEREPKELNRELSSLAKPLTPTDKILDGLDDIEAMASILITSMEHTALQDIQKQIRVARHIASLTQDLKEQLKHILKDES
jgi:hypothetical protein